MRQSKEKLIRHMFARYFEGSPSLLSLIIRVERSTSGILSASDVQVFSTS